MVADLRKRGRVGVRDEEILTHHLRTLDKELNRLEHAQTLRRRVRGLLRAGQRERRKPLKHFTLNSQWLAAGG